MGWFALDWRWFGWRLFGCWSVLEVEAVEVVIGDVSEGWGDAAGEFVGAEPEAFQVGEVSQIGGNRVRSGCGGVLRGRS